MKLWDTKFLIQLGVWMALLFVACKFTEGWAFALLIPVVILFIATANSTGLLFVIMLSAFSIGFNSFFISKTFGFVLCQKILMVSAAAFLSVQVFGRRQSRIVTPFLGIFPYLIFIFASSQVGWSPVISNLKLLLYVTIYFAFYGCAVRAMNERVNVRRVRSMLLVIAIFIVYGSFLIWPFTGISYMGSEEILLNQDVKSLFKGTTCHSQTLGVIGALLGVLLFSDWLFVIQKKSRLYLSLLVGTVILVYASASRTAMATFVFGIAFACWCAMQKNRVNRKWKSKVLTTLGALSVLGACCVLAVPQFREKAVGFILKRAGTDNFVSKESIMSSRQFKLDEALYHWHQSPLIGNGFQVSEDMRDVRISGIKNMLSAPVEKSTWTYAILEEGGVIGMILFVGFVLGATILLVKREAYVTATMFTSFLMSNMGEFTIFSMSGGGGMIWSLVFFATVLDFKKQQDDRKAIQCQALMADWASLGRGAW